jgi:hypothetical protein
MFGVARWASISSPVSSPGGTSLAIKFASEEPAIGGAAYDSIVEGAAGVLATEYWNNLEGATGEADGLKLDIDGAATDTAASVEWISNNTVVE